MWCMHAIKKKKETGEKAENVRRNWKSLHLSHRVHYTVPHHPMWNTPPSPTALHTGCTLDTPPAFMEHPPTPPQHCTPGVLRDILSTFMEHPPHITGHRV